MSTMDERSHYREHVANPLRLGAQTNSLGRYTEVERVFFFNGTRGSVPHGSILQRASNSAF